MNTETNQNTGDLTLEDSIKQVMATLPPPIRAYLAAGKYSEVAQRFSSKYALHVDQGGVLERELMLLLMGIENPQDFSESLHNDAKIESDTVNQIMTDINQEVFVPLQEQMRAAASAAPAPQKTEANDGSNFHLVNKIPLPGEGGSAIANAGNAGAAPLAPRAPGSVAQIPAAAPLPPRTFMPGAPAPVPQSRTAPPPASAPGMPPLVQPKTAPAPVNLPGVPRAPQSAPALRPATPRTPAPPYSVDPYREPPE